MGFRTHAHTPQQRGFDSFFGYFAGSQVCRFRVSLWCADGVHLPQDYWNHESLCWPGNFKDGCFENTTHDGAGVTGNDLHDGNTSVTSQQYSTMLYTDKVLQCLNEFGFVC